MGNGLLALVLFVIFVFEGYYFERGLSARVTYDSKALVIDGQRRILQSGSIHYPRATPEVWPEIIRKSKEGGLDVIETYVFWNYHEPVKGEYYFEGRFDLVRFVKTVQEAGLLVHLRIGPYVCAEWNYGGFPLWLHFIPGIQFRTTNDLFKNEMKGFLAKIVNLMKEENLFASQGGPIILAQVENEYGNVEWAYGIGGELYVQWAAETAVGLNTSVPWVMCAQEDAPDPIVVSQRNLGDDPFARTTSVSEVLLASSIWSWYKEEVGVSRNDSFTKAGLLEQINTTKDTSDYLWYTTSIFVSESIMPGEEEQLFLHIGSLGHAALVFVNKRLVGFAYGNHENASFTLSKKISLNQGNNSLDVLNMIIGLQNYGPWYDVAGAGIYSVILVDLKIGKDDFTSREWTYQVGLEGEYLGLDKTSLANSSLWTQGSAIPVNQSLIWYKTTLIAPEGKGPLALNLASMGKGLAWINGQSIGRYWSANLAPSTGCTDNCDYRGSYDPSKCLKNCGQPAQTLYHIPRTWVHPGENLLVLHEELGGDPSKVSLLTRTGQEICAHVSEADPPPADSWKPNTEFVSQSAEIRMTCERGWLITSINFASFGTPEGRCGTFSLGNCHADVSLLVQQACIGREGCSIPVSSANLGDPCPGLLKSFAIEALCSD